MQHAPLTQKGVILRQADAFPIDHHIGLALDHREILIGIHVPVWRHRLPRQEVKDTEQPLFDAAERHVTRVPSRTKTRPT